MKWKWGRAANKFNWRIQTGIRSSYSNRLAPKPKAPSRTLILCAAAIPALDVLLEEARAAQAIVARESRTVAVA